MNRCMFVSTFSEPAECVEQDCAGWNKLSHQCFVHSASREIYYLSRAMENLGRSINQAVLMKQKGVALKGSLCPKCETEMNNYVTHRMCPSCGYSDPYK